MDRRDGQKSSKKLTRDSALGVRCSRNRRDTPGVRGRGTTLQVHHGIFGFCHLAFFPLGITHLLDRSFVLVYTYYVNLVDRCVSASHRSLVIALLHFVPRFVIIDNYHRSLYLDTVASSTVTLPLYSLGRVDAPAGLENSR